MLLKLIWKCTKNQATLRTVDTVVGQGNKWHTHHACFLLKSEGVQHCIQLVIGWNHWDTGATYLLSGEVWMVFMEQLQPKSYPCYWKQGQETQLCTNTWKLKKKKKNRGRGIYSMAHSPDVKIIKSVWDYMKRQKNLRRPMSTDSYSLNTRHWFYLD